MSFAGDLHCRRCGKHEAVTCFVDGCGMIWHDGAMLGPEKWALCNHCFINPKVDGAPCQVTPASPNCNGTR